MAYVSVGAELPGKTVDEKPVDAQEERRRELAKSRNELKNKKKIDAEKQAAKDAKEADKQEQIGVFMTVFKGLLVVGGSYAGWRWWKKRKRSAA